MRESILRAAVGLLAVASLAAGTLLLAGHFSRDSIDETAVQVLPYPLVLAFLIVIGGLILAAVVRLLVVVFSGPTRRRAPLPWHAVSIVAAAFAVIVVVYVVFALILSFFEPPDEQASGLLPQIGPIAEEPMEEELPEVELQEEPSGVVVPEERSPVAVLVGAALALVAAAVVGIGAYRRYSARPDSEETERLDRLSRDLRAAGARALDRMLEEPDDRRAVVAAYALVEETLDRHGYPHDSSQTPAEFMEATLRALDSRAAASGRRGADEQSEFALRRLTELYEVAKFSNHPVGGQERSRAMACMREISSAVDFRGAPPAPGSEPQVGSRER